MNLANKLPTKARVLIVRHTLDGERFEIVYQPTYHFIAGRLRARPEHEERDYSVMLDRIRHRANLVRQTGYARRPATWVRGELAAEDAYGAPVLRRWPSLRTDS